MTAPTSDPHRTPGRHAIPRGRPILGVLALAVVAATIWWPSSRAPNLGYRDFQSRYWDAARRAYRDLAQARLQGDVLSVLPREPGDRWLTVQLPAGAVDSALLERLGSIPSFRVDPPAVFWPWLASSVLPAALVGLVAYMFLRKSSPPNASAPHTVAFGRSRPRLVGHAEVAVRFDDVAGIDEAKEEVREVVEYLRHPERFARLGCRMPRGVLFVGPPGAGKTLLARAVAGEAEAPFFSISGSDFVEMYVGVGASRVRDLFRQARERAPSIVFIDEIDAVGRRRGSGTGGGNDEREQTLNAILVEMDGFDPAAQVVVIAATNRPDVLDPALLRPGRFDREVAVDLPDFRGRSAILHVHARQFKLADDCDLERIARATPRFSGAELEALLNEAAIRAAMSDRNSVVHADLENARVKVRFGREQRSRMSDAEELHRTAVHEAGHALVAVLLEDAEPLDRVTIIPRGRALGATMTTPKYDRRNYTRRQLLAHLQVGFGGLVAEEICLGERSTGAEHDIAVATALARRMVCEFGMSELGPIAFPMRDPQAHPVGSAAPREFGEATAERVDREVERTIGASLDLTRRLLTPRRFALERLAAELVERETLEAWEVETAVRTAA